MSGFNFGNPTTTASTGFTFGTNPPAMGAPSNISFGLAGTPTPAAQAPASNLTFGPTTVFGAGTQGGTSAPAFGVATPQQQSSSVTFGTPSAQPPPPAFGATTNPMTPTLNFGATPLSTTPTANTGFSGLAAKPLGTSTLTFGTPNSSSTPLFGNAAAATTATNPAIATVQPTMSFGGAPVASVAPSTSFNFSAQPATAATGGLTFGATTTPATSTTAAIQPTFGGGFGVATSTAAPSLGGGFFSAKPATTSAAPLSTFGATAAPTIGSGAGFFGATLAGGPTTTAATSQPAAVKHGLGGIDVNATQPKPNDGHVDVTRCKETQLPQEIGTTVDALKQHIKQQKSISSDIARTYIPKLFNVSNDLQAFNWSLSEIANCIETNHIAVKSLRSDTANAIVDAEMARRTHETPSGLQMENTAPLQYFAKLIQKYETDMIALRNQVELIEKHMRQLSNPQNLTADDLKKGLQQMYESFVALAGRVHEIHQKVDLQKEQYLNLRKHLLKDRTNVFADVDDQRHQHEPTAKNNSNHHLSVCGPTPFSQMFNTSNLSMTNRLNNTAAWPSATTNTSLTTGGFGFNQSGFGGSSSSGFGNFGPFGGSTNTFGTSAVVTDAVFNLQKPPVGIKRNKQ